MRDYQADLYFLNISGDGIVHDQSPAGQAAFMRRLDEEFPTLIEGLAAQAKEADTVIFHTPTFEAHRHHISVQNVIALVQDWSLQRAVITHVNHDLLIHGVG